MLVSNFRIFYPQISLEVRLRAYHYHIGISPSLLRVLGVI